MVQLTDSRLDNRELVLFCAKQWNYVISQQVMEPSPNETYTPEVSGSIRQPLKIVPSVSLELKSSLAIRWSFLSDGIKFDP